MDSNRLIELIKFPESSSSEEREELLQLCQAFPFSAILKIVRAKIASINQSPELNKYLTSAAISTVDRVNLKHYIRSNEWEVSTLTSGQELPQEPEAEVSPAVDLTVETGSIQTEKEAFIEKIEREEKSEIKKEIPSGKTVKKKQKKDSEEKNGSTDVEESKEKVLDAGKPVPDSTPEKMAPEDIPAQPVESIHDTKKQEQENKAVGKGKDKISESESKRKAIEPSEPPESRETAELKEELSEKPAQKSISHKEEPDEITDATKVTPKSDSQKTKIPESPEKREEEISEKVSPGKEAQGKKDREEKLELSLPPEEKPEEIPAEKQVPAEPKREEPVSEKASDKEEVGPLASDLLKNIQEYRKNREFFEKMLDDHHKSGTESNLGGKNDQSGIAESGKEAIKTSKHKKDKKKKSESVKDKKDEKSAGKINEPEDELAIKKNFRDQDRKTGEELAETPESANSREEKKPDGKQQEKDSSNQKESSSEESRMRDERTVHVPDQDKRIPSEILDEKTIEKVTEEQKSEGYQVYEEEDPEVIKDFLEKISDEVEGFTHLKKLKKEEQVEIIERFIRSEPKIKNIKTAQALREREDLSAPSVKFKDDIISENLANIMKNQGKTEQAIDIYKKLIWKFPQKKAYFALQIEELKKKLGK